MNDNNIKTRVIAIIGTIAPEFDPTMLRSDQPLRKQVDLDSMDWLNVLLAIHDQLQVDIPEADYGKLATLDSLITYLQGKLAKCP